MKTMVKQLELTDLREQLATTERFSHLTLLHPRRDFYRAIIKEVDFPNYKLIYHAAAENVTKCNTEIDRLQRAIYANFPHDEAVAIIDAAPRRFMRNVIRDPKIIELRQKLEANREVRDDLVTRKQNEHVVDWAYQIVSAQGTVNTTKKSLYTHLRANGVETKHKDL